MNCGWTDNEARELVLFGPPGPGPLPEAFVLFLEDLSNHVPLLPNVNPEAEAELLSGVAADAPSGNELAWLEITDAGPEPGC